MPPISILITDKTLRRRCRLPGFIVLALAGLLLFQQAASAQAPPRPPAVRKPLGGVQPLKLNKPKLAQSDAVEDAGDFYMAAGKRVRLLRSKNEVVVRHSAAALRAADVQGFNQTKATLGVTGTVGRRFGKGARLEVLRSSNKTARINSRAAGSSAAVDFAYPVLVDPQSHKRMIPTDELLVGLADGVQLADVMNEFAAAAVTVVGPKGSPRMKAYLVRLMNAKLSDPLAVSQALAASPKLRWVTPNFIRELEPHLTPNDPLLTMQQALNNTGQNGAQADADVDAAEVWDKSSGSPSIVIAIIDDGVDTNHPDLRVAINPGESGGGKESNGIDDDGDGFIDNYRGWDFANEDNNPNPIGFNGHGTGCAGVAAATGDNAIGTAGIAHGCKILPIKVAEDSGDFTSDEAIGAAISYAAKFADVLSNSYGGGSPSPFIDAAIDDATYNGRDGKGCPVFFASGNSASTWYEGGGRWRLSTAGLNGNVRFGFFYMRGEAAGGENTLRIDNVCVLDANGYTHKNAFPKQDFEGTFPPPNWPTFRSFGATGDWSKSSVNALSGTGGQFSASSPSLPIGEYAWLFTSPFNVNGTESIAFAASADMPEDSFFYVDVYDATFSVYYGSYGPLNSGEASVSTDTGYPASSPNAIAVGASTDRDLRSDYSQYGGKLDFVAPSNGGWNDIATLDPVGDVGWTGTDYKVNFGGTSSACPLAAGVAALMLSVNPALNRDELLTIMRNTCDKIGGVTYAGGTNPFYGHGRLNASSALSALGIPTVVVSPTSSATNSNQITFTLTFSEVVTGLTTDGIVVTNGVKGALAGSGASYTLEVTPSAQGAVTCQVAAGAAQNALLHQSAASNIASVIFDSVAPEIAAVNFASNNSNPSKAKAGNVVTVTFGVTEAIQIPVVTIAGHAATVTNIAGNLWKGSYVMSGTDPEGIVSFEITVTDQAGNMRAPITVTTDNSTVSFDRTIPTITLSGPSMPIVRNGTVTYLVTYADTSPITSTLTPANITLHWTGTANGTVGVTGSGMARTVLISGISGNGTLGISIAAGTASDSAGNSAPAAGPSTTFIVDNTAPTLVIGPPSAGLTAAASVSYLVTYADANFNGSSLAVSAITLNKTGTANGTFAVTGSGTTRTVTISGISGEGTLGISIAAGTASDRAGNTALASGASATFAVDNTAPSLAIGGPSATLTKSANVSYTVTYADSHFNASTLAPADITLNKTGTANGIATISGAGLTRTVTVSGIAGNGTLGISIGGGTASDLAGNTAAPTGPSATFTVDNTAPTLTSVHLASDNAFATLAKVGDRLTLSFTTNEPIQSPTVMLAGQLATIAHVSGNDWTATTTVTSGTAEGLAELSVSFADLAGNAGVTVTAPNDASAVAVDLTSPAVTSAHITSTNGNPLFAKMGDTLTLTFTANEALQPPSVNIAGQAATVVNVSGNLWAASLTLGADVNQGAAAIFIHFSDLAGNVGTSVTGTSDDSEVIVDNVPPEITSPPLSYIVNPGVRVTLSVTADSLSPASYQWFKDTLPIASATSATLSFNSVTEIDQANYAVVMTNVAGSTSSDVIRIDVNDPVKIIQQPRVQMVNQNVDAVFSVNATGTGSLSYQWRRNGSPIDDANASSYTIAQAQPADQDLYDVVIANIVGSEQSDPAELVVFTGAPKIVSQPASLTVMQDMGTSFSVTADGTAPFTYQWLKAGVPIPNATSATYALQQTQDADAGVYGVVVSNDSGYAISDAATLTVVKDARYAFSTLAGTAGSTGIADAAGAAARFSKPEMVVPDSAGNFFVTDRNNHTIRKVTPEGAVSLFAGRSGLAGISNGSSSEARFSGPAGLAIDADNNLYVADNDSHLIRKVTPEGVVSTLAGTANIPGAADGTGIAAAFFNPCGVAVNQTGTLYVTDSGNHIIRKISSEGIVSTLAGVAGSAGAVDGAGDAARFNNPAGLAVDSLGNLYVADAGNHAIRKITPEGLVSTVAGLKGKPGSHDSVGTAARFKSPNGVAVDGSGNVFVCDSGNNTLRMITPAGTVNTIGGTTTAGSADGTGSSARFRMPQGISVDAQGTLCLADTNNHTIRQGVLMALPLIEEQPASLLVEQGQAVTFTVSASGAAPLSYQWRKNGAPIAGATNNSYSIPASALTHAGSYSAIVKNAVGTVTTTAARLGVVNLTDRTIIANEGTAVSLTAAAAGDGLIYTWQKNGVDLPNSMSGGHSVAGINASKLVIKAVNTSDTADYSCIIRLGTARLSTGITNLNVYNSAPVIILAPETILAPAMVAGSYHFSLPVDPLIRLMPTSFSASGLPPGMKIDPATGVISGRPTAASAPGKPYRITITAANARGRTSIVVLLTVSALPANAIGTFNGLADANGPLNNGYGGRFSIVSTSTGSFSGTVVLAGRTSRFTGALDAPPSGNPTASVTLARTSLTPELLLQFTIDIGNGELQGSLSTGQISTLVGLTAWRSTVPQTNLAGRYTAALSRSQPTPLANNVYPNGEGYLTLKLDLTGNITWSGKLSDGTALTGAATRGPDGQVPVHAMLYSNTGSIQGWNQINSDDSNIDGLLQWVKTAQPQMSTTRSYKTGFLQHTLTLTGDKYFKPSPGQMVFDLPATLLNAQLAFSGGGLDESFSQPFTITTTNTVQMPANEHLVKVSVFNSTTGLFGGAFTVADEDPRDVIPPFAISKRTASFNGVLVQRLGRGAGHFLLQRLPENPAQNIKNTAILSGRVSLEGVPSAP